MAFDPSADGELQRMLSQAPQPTVPIKQITLNAVNIGVQKAPGGPTPNGGDIVMTFVSPNGEAYVVPMPKHVARMVGQKLLDESKGPSRAAI